MTMLNWRKLINRRAQIHIGPMLEGACAANVRGVSALFGTEMGTTKFTKHFRGGCFDLDWSVGAQAACGVGVGYFVWDVWEGSWCVLDCPGSRFYLFECGGAGIFYVVTLA